MANCSSSQEDLPVTNYSEKAELGIQMSTFVSNADLPPPYTVSDTAPTPVPPVQLQAVNNHVVQPTILISGVLKNNPVYIHCPNCQQRSFTSVQLVHSQKTHMLAGFICGLTVWCMLCCLAVIPYMVPACKNADHYCSHCYYFIGSYSNSRQLS